MEKGKESGGTVAEGALCHRSPRKAPAYACDRWTGREQGCLAPTRLRHQEAWGPHPPGKLHSTAIDQKEPCRWSQMGANGDKSQTDGDSM